MAKQPVSSDVGKWLQHIASYDREFKKWSERGRKINERYRDEQRRVTENTSARFNILWSNVQTLVPATFSKLPVPDVSRRFRDNDPVGRVAALMLERALDFEIQNYPDYRETMKSCVQDRFLPGRGTAWVRYEPHIRAVQLGQPQDGEEITEDADVPEEELDYECAPVDYVHWRDFGHTIARSWDEVTAVWRKVYLTRQACVKRFGEDIGSKIPLDARPEDMKKDRGQGEDEYDRALVYEIWDKETKKAYWLSKSMTEFLDEKDDPLDLDCFFPCPKPLYATLTTDSLVPVPDFSLYQDQAIELDTLADRIRGLIQALKVRGIYNAEFRELSRLFTEGENNVLIPVSNFAAFAEKQGLKGAIDLVDLGNIVQALDAAYRAMEQVKQQIYDITGLADIVRGQSVASETATAQQLKGQYASMRLNSMKHAVSQFATEVLQLKAQVICTNFDPQTIIEISGAMQLSPEDQQMIPQAMEMLKNDVTRAFRIDISADSLVQIDESQEKQDRMEFLAAVGGYLREAIPLISQSPDAAPMVLELMKFGVTGFKVGKGIEGIIDQNIEEIRKKIQQMQNQPPPPNPEMLKLQAQQQSDQARAQADAMADQARAQADAAIKQAQMQAEMKMEEQRLMMESRIEQERMAREMEMKAMQTHMEMQFEQWKAMLEARTEIEKAEISASTVLSQPQINAAGGAAQ